MSLSLTTTWVFDLSSSSSLSKKFIKSHHLLHHHMYYSSIWVSSWSRPPKTLSRSCLVLPLTDPTYLDHPLCTISALYNPFEQYKSLKLCQINSELYETWNLNYWWPILLIPFIWTIPYLLSVSSITHWSCSGSK